MNPATTVRTALLVGGGCALVAGVALLGSPAADALIRWPWDDALLLVAFFTLVFVIAAAIGPLSAWPADGPSDSEPTIPERVPSTPRPGAELERIVDRRWPASLPRTRRRRLREQLREATAQTLVRTKNCDPATADRLIAAGTWTDDPVAAAFVRRGADGERSAIESLIDRVRFPCRLRRTMAAVDSIPTREVDDP